MQILMIPFLILFNISDIISINIAKKFSRILLQLHSCVRNRVSTFPLEDTFVTLIGWNVGQSLSKLLPNLTELRFKIIAIIFRDLNNF
jgi:hypothetical protein